MPRFAANLSFLYTDLPFLDRFAAAAADGFEGVEYLFPYEHPPEAIAQRLRAHGLTQALFNLPAGDWDGGERGLACLPGREAEFAASVRTALPYALATGCNRLHALAGIAPADVPQEVLLSTYVANLRHACDALAPHGITLMVEPINSRDMPGYFLTRQDAAHAVRAAVGRPNLQVQMDLYHCQVMEGDLAMRLRRHLAEPGAVGHVQVAGVPGRHEPDDGEVNYPYLFVLLDELGYEGWVGCEYKPRAGTSAGLGWLRRWRDSRG